VIAQPDHAGTGQNRRRTTRLRPSRTTLPATRSLNLRPSRREEPREAKVIAVISARIVGAVLCLVFAFATSAFAEGASVLWARTCDVRSQACGGEWQRRETYEADRWCRAAWTAAVNQALTPEGRAVANARGTVLEYQCLPDTVDPRGSKGSK